MPGLQESPVNIGDCAGLTTVVQTIVARSPVLGVVVGGHQRAGGLPWPHARSLRGFDYAPLSATLDPEPTIESDDPFRRLGLVGHCWLVTLFAQKVNNDVPKPYLALPCYLIQEINQDEGQPDGQRHSAVEVYFSPGPGTPSAVCCFLFHLIMVRGFQAKSSGAAWARPTHSRAARSPFSSTS